MNASSVLLCTLADYVINFDSDEEREIAAKMKASESDSVVNNPQYISVEERHVYDVVGRGENPYEEVHLGHSPAQHKKQTDQHYSNPNPPLPSIPSFPNHQGKDHYDVPKNNSLSSQSSASPFSFTPVSGVHIWWCM